MLGCFCVGLARGRGSDRHACALRFACVSTSRTNRTTDRAREPSTSTRGQDMRRYNNWYMFKGY
jgi:hypothetical protein